VTITRVYRSRKASAKVSTIWVVPIRTALLPRGIPRRIQVSPPVRFAIS
jgi:hypothetical protein